jgi:tetratricopeptide (TPR) repeat protein
MDKRKNNKHKTEKTKTWIFAILLGLIILGIYHNSLNAPFIYDDKAKIVENPDIRKLSNIKTKLIYPYGKYKTFKRNDPSRPLTYLTFTFNYHFGKLNPFGYHLFNILLHIFSSILIFLLTKRILFYTYKESSDILPIFVALLFAVHPINTNVVTYTFARSDALATLFYLSSLLFFIKTLEGSKKAYILSLFFCVLSFSAKPIAVTLPAMILIFDYLFLSEYEIRRVMEKKYYHLAFWVILIGYLLFRYFYLGGIGDVESEAPLKVPTYPYLLTQTNVLMLYIKSLIIPTGLCIMHWLKLAKTIFEFRVLCSIFFLMGILLITWKVYKKKTNWSKIVVFCVLWFFISLSPTSSIFPTTAYMDDKRLYLSGLGFYLAMAFAYFSFYGKATAYGKKWKQILLSIAAIYISLLAVATYKRNQLYGNPVLVWQDVIARYPDNFKAHNNLGLLYKNEKRYDEAIQEYQRALDINPGYDEAHTNLGVLYHGQKRYDEAIGEYEKALSLKPNDAEAWNNLGVSYHSQKKYDKAVQAYQQALVTSPDYADAHNNLGVLYYEQKRYNEAIQEYRMALDINPDYAEVRNNLGVAYKESKRYEEAIEQYQKALAINPNYAGPRNNLGILYKELKKYDKAIEEYRKAIDINPMFAEAHNNLGLLYSEQKRYDSAIEEYQKAIEINLDYADARYNLALLYYAQNDYKKSLDEFQTILTLNSISKSLRQEVEETVKRFPTP